MQQKIRVSVAILMRALLRGAGILLRPSAGIQKSGCARRFQGHGPVHECA